MYYAIANRTVIGPHIARGAWAVILSLLPGWYWKGQWCKTPGKQQRWKAPSFSSEPVETHPPEPWWSPPLCKTKGKTCNTQLYIGFIIWVSMKCPETKHCGFAQQSTEHKSELWHWSSTLIHFNTPIHQVDTCGAGVLPGYQSQA